MKKLITMIALTAMLVGCGKNETSGSGNNGQVTNWSGTGTTWNTGTTGTTGQQSAAEALQKRNEVEALMNAQSVTGGVNGVSKFTFSTGSCSTYGCASVSTRRYIVQDVTATGVEYELKKGSLCIMNCSLGNYVYDAAAKASDMSQVFSDSGRTLYSVYQGSINGQSCYQIRYLQNGGNGTYEYIVCPNLPAIANPVYIMEQVSGGEIRSLTSY
jgi:hypothetical protein